LVPLSRTVNWGLPPWPAAGAWALAGVRTSGPATVLGAATDPADDEDEDEDEEEEEEEEE
jgi:hypothetical protein